jgi:hypothetical protein
VGVRGESGKAVTPTLTIPLSGGGNFAHCERKQQTRNDR